MSKDYFGCYAILPQYKSLEDGLIEYRYKVIGLIKSNTWREPPYGMTINNIPENFKGIVHDHTELVFRVIQMGVMEEEVIRVAVKDVIKLLKNDGETEINIPTDKEREK